jgi:hypothetical protein
VLALAVDDGVHLVSHPRVVAVAAALIFNYCFDEPNWLTKVPISLLCNKGGHFSAEVDIQIFFTIICLVIPRTPVL